MSPWLLSVLLFCIGLIPGCATYTQFHTSGGYSYILVWQNEPKTPMQSWARDSGFPPAATGEPVRTNGKLAVAQLGESAPESWMIEPVIASKRFASVEPCAGGERHRPMKFPHSATRPTTQEAESYAYGFLTDYMRQAQAAMDAARLAARGQGCDYVLVVIGQSSGQYNGSVIPLIDILLFPLYVIPHEKAGGTAEVVAFLIDTTTGQIVRQSRGAANAMRLGTYINLKHAVPLAIAQAQNRVGLLMAEGICETPKGLK